ncbi:SRPBCC family protein [Streptomyces sp. NPDC086549]|uniref:SRPBCC family protein n=1 Tax=Streptomyces sp. NPDC086549 TaxID=3365752 RepID=UPI00381F7D28
MAAPTATDFRAPLPVRDYEAVITLHDNPDPADALVTWDSAFEPAGADEGTAAAVITGVLQDGLDAVK